MLCLYVKTNYKKKEKSVLIQILILDIIHYGLAPWSGAKASLLVKVKSMMLLRKYF